MWKRTVLGSPYSQGEFNGFNWKFSEELTHIHPVEWLINNRNEYTNIKENGKQVRYDYTLISWQEVEEEIYNAYKDEIDG